MPAATSQPPVKLSLPLQFQQEIYQLLRAEDVLVILARGLGLLKIVTNLLHTYDAAGNSLVIIVGAEDRENEWIGEALAEHYAISRTPLAKGLRVINTDKATVAAREKIYSEGGIVSVTSRILIVDLLSKLLDPETVTGLVVLHAERVVATSIEAFIVRSFRQHNKIGFLKAFSDSPEPLISSYAPLASMMRNLFLRKPSLWPRFHVSIAQSLEGKKKAEVIELEIEMTAPMKAIQQAVMECVETSISELKKANSGLEMDDWTLDSALHQNFDAIVRRQLDPVWHRISWRTKQIANDLTVLRTILHSLLSYDCVSLLKYLDTVLATHSPPPNSRQQDQSPWLYMDAAAVIFNSARGRVYSGKVEDHGALPTSKLPDSLTPVLEEQPKWAVLAELLQEIETDAYLTPTRSDSNETILVMCNDLRTCRQIREYLQTMHVKPTPQDTNDGRAPHEVEEQEAKGSAEFMLRRKLREYLVWRDTFSQVSSSLFEENQKSLNNIKGNNTASARLNSKAPANKRRRVRGGGASGLNPFRAASGAVAMVEDKAAHVASLLADLRPTGAEALQKEDVMVDDLTEAGEDFFELYTPEDQIVVHPYDGDQDDQLLEEIRPKYIIMFSPSADFIRRVEVYRSSHSDRSVRVYFLYYGNSVEEQRYLSAVRREKDAFTKLIKERGSMAVTLADANVDPEEAFLRTVNTRIAGGGRLAATAAPPRVVVDVREFRSSLPSLLHGRSMQIVPCQLTVADYVLSPDICVERKSIPDLIGSFNNGRLYNQAETMLQHYKYPFLLIEFDQNKSFTLDPFADLSGTLKAPDAETRSLQTKLVLLTIRFPRLKIIWASSPYQTAEIFEELKKQQEEPDPYKAVQVGLAAGEDPEERTFNTGPQELLRTIPGVTDKNASRLYLETRNVLEVANMSLEELDPLVGREAGRQIVRFFTRTIGDEEDPIM
ncbi:DNA repair protein rad16 [Cladophialophora carrionii]|uniref:DNA repair protein rad16 n=1 Tax=Cladophialophora carrionii TaxID=86049 RepID=A0A1C1D1I7_9EURO|nr:DNA repair protein rad16 [Cladophialophora carrionii]